jgi:hypothetical protein
VLINSFPYRLGSLVSCSLFENQSWLLLKWVNFFIYITAECFQQEHVTGTLPYVVPI